MKKNKQGTKILGAEVRQARQTLGEVTQQSLADIIGSSQSEVSRWEGPEKDKPVPPRFAERIRKLLYRRRLGLPLLPAGEELIEYHAPSHAPADAPRVFLGFGRKPKAARAGPPTPAPAPSGDPAPKTPADPPSGGPPASALTRKSRWTARTELRILAACLFFCIFGTGFMLRSELRELHRPTFAAHGMHGRTPGPKAPVSEPPVHTSIDAGDTNPHSSDAPDGGVAWDMTRVVVPEPEPGDTPEPLPPARPIPAQPTRNQKRPPCFRPPRGREVEMSGACYIKIEGKPPCGEDAYESEGSCYIAVGRRERRPSFDPQGE